MGDVELNPVPTINNEHCLSILHQNIRGIPNKLEYIRDNYLDLDILCFTETKLNFNISDNNLELDGFQYMFRKDVTSQSSGCLSYVSGHSRPTRILELENLLSESL